MTQATYYRWPFSTVPPSGQGGLGRFRRVLFPAYTFQPLMLWSRGKLTQRLEVGLAIVHHVQGDGHGLAVAAIQ